MTEEWRPVAGFEGAYEVSSEGRVRSMNRTLRDGRSWRGRVLRHSLDASGHPVVHLNIDGAHLNRHVHTLVLEAFVGPRPEGMEGCHGEGGPADNRPSNLRWDTRSENLFDRGRQGTDHYRNRTHCPFGRLLEVPNLRPAELKIGHRKCLACSRGRGWAQHYKIAYTKAIGDRYYTEIMEGVTA